MKVAKQDIHADVPVPGAAITVKRLVAARGEPVPKEYQHLVDGKDLVDDTLLPQLPVADTRRSSPVPAPAGDVAGVDLEVRASELDERQKELDGRERALKDEIDRVKAGLSSAADDADARVAALDERERDLDERQKELDERQKALDEEVAGGGHGTGQQTLAESPDDGDAGAKKPVARKK